MRELVARFRPYFLYAGLFSLVINLLLLAPPLYMLQVFDRVLASRSEETLLMLTLAAGGALVLMAMLDVVRARLLIAASVSLERSLGPPVLERALKQAAGGAAASHAAREVSVLRSFIGGTGILAVFDAPWLPFFLLLIFLFHPLLGAVAAAGGLAMLLLAFLSERLTRARLERVQAEGRRAGRFSDASLRNAEVVGALGMHAAVKERWMELNDRALLGQLRAGNTGGTLAGLSRFTRQFIQLAMLGVGAYLVLGQHVTAGVMMAATIILGRALAPVESMVAGWRSLVEARSAWRRLKALLEEEESKAGTELPPPLGRVEVEHAVCKLSAMERPILKGISFGIAPGETLGLIGPSAAGKSTLARLIVGVWKPASGTVRLDGADVAAWPRARLGPHVGYLPQDVELFAGTVAQNIARLGEPVASDVVRAAQRAGVHEMILRLPKGYDTELGDAGEPLSPGQRQRVGLARALYGQPKLVVLDEPNANLDRDGDEALMQALALLKAEGTTVIVIAHRPSLLATVDKLLVLRDGAIDLFGPRAEVMARVTRPVREVA